MGKILLLVLSIGLSSSAWSAGNKCPSDLALLRAGWVIHSTSDFKSIAGKVQKWFTSEPNNFVEDLSGTVYSSVASKMVTINSFDYIPTPQGEMFGDVAFFTDFRSDELIEVRWYDLGKRHVVYDKSQTPCATNSLPMAENALF
ncbi:MAG: hypothetical protein KDD43_09125 [Bdellovibrionales bacterium]|nr:hypothetical protein [Bdellovibrionales bacterium]